MSYDIRKYAVIGAGNMGSGIAQKIATEGYPVVLVDLDDEKVERGMSIIKGMLAQGVERKVFRPEQVERILGNLQGTSDWSELADVDLVIEAVFEDVGVKRKVFERLSEVCKPTAILGTNTSSFFVKDLVTATKNPERLVGLHYFFHPAKNRLVEVIGHEGTEPAAFDAAWTAQEAIGKTPIWSADAPGFVVNRYFVPWVNEAVRLLDEGVADIPTIEWAAKKCFGVGMGPFELMNVTGVPISMHAANTLGEQLHAFYAPATGLCTQVEGGHGDWDLQGDVDESKYDAVAERMLGVTFYVAAQLVSEGVGSVEDTDIGARVGLRWPTGPFELMNHTGLERAAGMARGITARWGLELPEMLEDPADDVIPIALSRYEERDGMAWVSLNRPDALNALNVPAVEQLMTRVENARLSGAKATVLAATGKAFAAGADVKFFVDNLERDAFPPIYHFARNGQDLYRALHGRRQPVVARVQGLCLGGGAEMAVACDWIVCSPKAAFGFPETGIGIIPGLGGTQRTPRRIGLPLAKWLIYTGQVLDAKTAVAIGLADELVPFADLDEACARIAERGRMPERSAPDAPPSADWQPVWDFFSTYTVDQILGGEADPGDNPWLQRAVKSMGYKSPQAWHAAERMLDYTARGELDYGLDAELDSLQDIFLHPDALEGMKALLEGRRPAFQQPVTAG
jgi:enoyl-CoA hydratase/3-hydroxyacyl-CoA dehydrogenase